MSRDESLHVLSLLVGLPGHGSEADREDAVRTLVAAVEALGADALSDEGLVRVASLQQERFTEQLRGAG